LTYALRYPHHKTSSVLASWHRATSLALAISYALRYTHHKTSSILASWHRTTSLALAMTTPQIWLETQKRPLFNRHLFQKAFFTNPDALTVAFPAHAILIITYTDFAVLLIVMPLSFLIEEEISSTVK
jgi:hypothetical protein